MTEFLFEFANAHPYLTYAFFFTGLMFLTLWYLIHTVGSRQADDKKEDKPELSVPPSPEEIEKLKDDHDVNLAELDLEEAILHCEELGEKTAPSLCSANHIQLAKWLDELKQRRSQDDVGKRGFAAGFETPEDTTNG